MRFAAPTERGATLSLPRRHICIFALIMLTALPVADFAFGADDISAPLAWPAVTAESRPWTRWWWLGSAVDKENLTRLLEEYHKAGIGGVEICPIYGAKGSESRFIPFLSPQWIQMLAHTSSEARRLDMGLDLTCGT